jgi:hypothetical protein
MEKKDMPPDQDTSGIDMVKMGSTPAARDVDFGQVLETTSTPELERKVLWKLDL